ncbi:MAG: hypothetical protein QOE83_1992 [Actinomycetota bacterium]|jgi:hypothetical protein|nr:hypothetical protein [Actinomycetota bacterium]
MSLKAPWENPLEILSLPLPFLHKRLLTTQDFISESRKRDVTFDYPQLEAFHQAGVLLPLYRLRRDVRAIKAQAQKESRSALDGLIYTPTVGNDLLWYYEHGWVLDPRAEPYRAWNRFDRELDGFRYRSSEFLYSSYQLLGVASLQRLITRLKCRRLTPEALTYRCRLAMRDLDWFGLELLPSQEVILLSALETYYLPRVTGVASMPWGGEDAWENYQREFSPKTLLARLGWTVDEVFEFGRRLLFRSSSLDPMPDWFTLVRNASSKTWERFKGVALTSIDYRIAGEMVLRFCEEVTEQPSSEFLDLDRLRLRPDKAALDDHLTGLGLSPHPSVVLAFEGKTELTLAPLVLAHLGLSALSPHIRMVDGRGVGSNFELLAAYAVTPDLGREFPRGAILNRPTTHLMVIRDAEGRSSTRDQRENIRIKWLARVMSELPREFANEYVQRQIEPLVTVETWAPDDPMRRVFEFAHFSDAELARSINRVHRAKGGKGGVKARDVAPIRANTQNIEEAWRGLWPKPRKTEIARDLWPTLRAMIDRAADRGQLESIPIVRIVIDAARLAQQPMFGRVALIRSEEPSVNHPQ